MEENNKLIAEFMGNPTIFNNVHDATLYQVKEKDNMTYHVDELQYHLSWDWLMPVAEKCLTSDEKTDGQHYFINDALLTCNIEVVYDRVVEFIKDYNNGKEQ